MVSAEETLATGLYCQKIQQTYQDCFHFVVSWDPSTYDVETMVSIVFSGQGGPNGMAAYLPIQNMKSVLKSEVDPQIRALSHSLQAIGWPLEKFQFPKGLLWRPLEEFEHRIFEHGHGEF